MSMSQAMGFFLKFRVRSISPGPFQSFSLNFTQMLLSLRWCAVPMIQLTRLEVTIQGHVILPFNLCPLHIS